MLYDDIIADIAAHTDASQAQVQTLFEDSGVQSVRNDNRFYRAAGLEGIVRMSDAALQTLNAGYQKCGESLKNLTLTTANTSQQMYINGVNNAYMQVTSGAFDYNTAIRKAVQNAAEQGSYVMYPSGHTDRLDVAVRRAVMTGVGQTVRKLSEINAADMGTDLMEITAHSGARPSHAEWQGQIVSLSGRKGYLSKSDIGYGTGDGFGGWNCRHDWFPFFEGASQRAYTPERLDELNARNIEYDGKKYTQYEISQIQRKMERDIRAAKRGVIAADTARKNAGSDTLEKQFDEDFTTASVKLKSKEKKLSDFLEKTKQLPDNARTQVLGFGRSQAQKAVWENKKVLQLLDKDDIINKDKIMSGYKKYISKYPDSNFNYYMINYKLKEAGIKRGVPLVTKPKNAAILPDLSNNKDPYHIMHRMKERLITDDDLRTYMQNAKVMFAQWNGKRLTFYSDNGVVVLHNSGDGWIFKTTWNKPDFDEITLKIIEVIKKYVG